MIISPIDLIKAYRKYGPIDVRLLPELIELEQKQNTMKKYKVVTDNLDWAGIHLGTIIYYNDVPCLPLNSAIKSCVIIELLLKKHPEWLQEIKDHPKEYTKEDMCYFAEFVNNRLKTKDKSINWPEQYLLEWNTMLNKRK